MIWRLYVALLAALIGCSSLNLSSIALCGEDGPPPDVVVDAMLDASPCTADPSPDPMFPDSTGQGHLTVTLRAPDNYADDPCKKRRLLVLLNGYKADGGSAAARFKLIGVENAYDVLTIAPTGIVDPRPTSTGYRRWNATPACCEPTQPANNDRLYLSTLIEAVKERWSVDQNGVYVVGASNGAAMGMRLACERPDQIAGVVAIAGIGMSGGVECVAESPELERPIHVAFHHSKADGFFLYSGGTANFPPLMPAPYPPVEGPSGAIEQLRAKNGCLGSLTLNMPLAYDFDWPGPPYLAGIADTDLLTVGGCLANGSVTLWRAPYPAPVTYGHSLHATEGGIPPDPPTFREVLLDWIATHQRVGP